MEVLSKTDLDSWSAEITCDNCDSQLKIDRHDLHSELIKAYSYEEEDYNIYHVHCPVCNKPSRVPLNIIPKLIKVKY